MTNAAWRAERPSEEGYYWRRGLAEWNSPRIITELVHIKLSPAGYPNMEVIGSSQYSPRFHDKENEWIGPLEVPQ